MRLKTDRLKIVPLDIKYLSEVHSYTSDIENTRNMLFLPNKSVGETEMFILDAMKQWQSKEQRIFEFVIFMEEKLVGSVSIDILDDNITGEFGWIINKKYWRKGIATEAARAVLEFGKEKLNLKRFVAHCDSENIGSKTVMEKLNMKLLSSTPGRVNRDGSKDRIELEYELII